MSDKKDCKCGNHGKKHHKEMSHAETVEHSKECLDNIIEKLQCLRESLENLQT